jgi:trans-L-3-hydroxyproline dehydratase
VTPDGDTGVLFLHNEGFSTMCGHGIIAVVTVGIETGLLRPGPDGAIRIDTPAGRVTARAHLTGKRVERVSFRNVPSFVLAKDLVVDVPGLGPVTCDIAFGGAFYAYVDAASVGAHLEPSRYAEIIDIGMRVKRAVAAAYPIVHPTGASDLDFLYGAILCEKPAQAEPGLHSRNVCIFAEGEVDRSPTGTGVSGRAAIHHARGDLAAGETITIESLVGSRFDVRVVETTSVGSVAAAIPAVIPEVTGSAWITGRHEFLLDPNDPFREGFLLR